MELIYQLAIYEKAPNEMTVSLQHFEESGFGEKPVWWAFVATSPPTPLPGVERGEEVRLWVSHYTMCAIRHGKAQRMYLEDFLVNEEMRGKGIGKLLFDKLIEEAKERKFNGIVWQVLDWNEPAINFYKKYDGVTIENGWLNCSINF
ncbi:MAG: GNAT family N-acetyltransferase [Chitinophagaceae bacterium]